MTGWRLIRVSTMRERLSRTMLEDLAKYVGLTIRYDSRGGYTLTGPRGTSMPYTLREAVAYVRGYQDAVKAP